MAASIFRVPANKELFFQALNEQGLAVQSMRSATQVRQGEQLVCGGCHNPRHRVSASDRVVPLALRCAPSDADTGCRRLADRSAIRGSCSPC